MYHACCFRFFLSSFCRLFTAFVASFRARLGEVSGPREDVVEVMEADAERLRVIEEGLAMVEVPQTSFPRMARCLCVLLVKLATGSDFE